MVYNPAVPTGTVPLNVDYQNLQNNFSQLDTSFGVDHVPFSTILENGKHTVVHLLNQVGVPADDTASGQIYSYPATIPAGGDHQLFFKSPNTVGQGRQISGDQASANGFGWFSGILCQWGFQAYAPLGLVTFATANVAFPSSCFGVWTQPTSTGGTISGNTAMVNIKINTNVSFAFSWTGATANYNGFYWIAIGV